MYKIIHDSIFISIKNVIKRSLFTISPSLLKRVQKYNNKFIHKKRLELQLEKLPTIISNYYIDSNNDEIKDIIPFTSKNGIYKIPFEFIYKYKPGDVNVYYDEKVQYPYVVIGQNRFYFPRNTTKTDIENSVMTSIIELQEEQEPHDFLTKSINFDCDDIAVFVGAYEGISCLSIIEKVRKVYLFEADEQWITPLTLTFATHQDKVKIVQKFVSSDDNDNQVSLDNYFSQIGEDVNYIQADIEGNEMKLISGAKKILSGNNIKFRIFCYNNQDDQSEFSILLSKYGFKIQYSKGYMLLRMQAPCAQPYFRKGIIHASKN